MFLNRDGGASVNTLTTDYFAVDLPADFFATSDDYLAFVLEQEGCATINECGVEKMSNYFLYADIFYTANNEFTLLVSDPPGCPVYFYETTPDAAVPLLDGSGFHRGQAWQSYGGPLFTADGQTASSRICFSLVELTPDQYASIPAAQCTDIAISTSIGA